MIPIVEKTFVIVVDTGRNKTTNENKANVIIDWPVISNFFLVIRYMRKELLILPSIYDRETIKVKIDEDSLLPVIVVNILLL